MIKLAPPAASIATCSAAMSFAGSNRRRSLPHLIVPVKKMRRRSAPDASRRGTSVSAASSSPDQITTFPCLAALSSGQRLPAETVAAIFKASVVLPAPGWPAIMCILPRASQPCQSHDTNSGLTFEARTKSTMASPFGCPAGALPLRHLPFRLAAICESTSASSSGPIFARRQASGSHELIARRRSRVCRAR